MYSVDIINVVNDFDKLINMVINDNVHVKIITDNGNAVMLSETDYNELEKTIRNAEYLEKIDHSIIDVNAGRIITKTIDELESTTAE